MKKKLMSFVLTLVMCLALCIPAIAAYAPTGKVDMSLESESNWQSSLYPLSSKNLAGSKNVYVPDGARVLSIDTINDNLVVDYQLDGVRYIVSYLFDGSIRKSARAVGSDIVQEISTIQHDVKITNLSNQRFSFDAQNEALMDDASTARRARTQVIPLMYTDVSGTRPYNARIVEAGTVNLPALSALGHSAIQNYRIYSSMDYFEENETSGRYFSAGDAVDAVALFWEVSTTSAVSWLTAAGIAITVYDKLAESCQAVNECTYTYQGGKEAGIYDPTYHNTFVEVVGYWSPGMVALIWDHNPSTGYNSPTWGHTSRSEALMINNSSLKNEAQEKYNGNVFLSGWWPFGTGRFGY